MKISKKIMEQYEVIRQSGLTNMFDYYNVILIATKMKYYALGNLTRDEYKEILMNFNKLMKKYNIKQSKE